MLFVMDYAIIETGGKQYKVGKDDELYVEKLKLESGAEVSFKAVALFRDGKISLGDFNVKASVLKNGKGKKITVFTYKAKKNCKRKMGHRQPYTKIKINSISG